MKNNKVLVSLWKVDLFYRLYLRFISLSRARLKLIYRLEDLNPSYYNKIKNVNEIELEHQIGRLTNFKKIIQKCPKLDGDFIEFGTWRGFSLLWTAFFMQNNAILNKKLIGLDGFVGLPATEGVFRKYLFSDATLSICRNNIYKSDEIYEEMKKNVTIEKFMLNQKKEILLFLKSIKARKFCFIHVDIDISLSLREVMDLLTDGDLIADKAYILFDDYNCNKTYKKNVDKEMEKLKKNWKIKTVSRTKLTRNYYLELR